MRSGKDLILATKEFAHEQRGRSWWYTLSTYILLVAAIAGTFLPWLAVRIFCSVATAALLSRFFIIFHDFQHHTILNRSKMADVLFTIFGFYMITPPSIWKRSHDHHHNNNSKLWSASIGSYPVMTRAKFLAASPKEKFGYLATRSPYIMVLSYFTMFLYGMCLQSFLSSPKRHLDSLFTLIIHVAIAVFLFVEFGWLTWFLTFFLPFLLSHMLGAYLFYAQHNFPGVSFQDNKNWTYAHAALQSSSYMRMNPLMQWITANIGFHHVHHLNAKIPFYRLQEAMKALPELQHPKITSFKLHDMVSCLRLKVWDAENREMIGFREMRKMPALQQA
ncbi:MAG: fatty acid desaturase [Chitinophagaceae bacterium]